MHPRHKIDRLDSGIVSATKVLDASTNHSFGRDATDGTANSGGQKSVKRVPILTCFHVTTYIIKPIFAPYDVSHSDSDYMMFSRVRHREVAFKGYKNKALSKIRFPYNA